MRRTCCRAGAGPNGGNGASRKGSRPRSSPCRKRGMNRYEIHAALRERRDTVPSPSTIYRVLRRYQLNRRTPAMREEKRRIIKDKLGELGHVDLHQLPRDMFLAPPPATAYIVSLIDSCSRLAWAEVLTSKKALPVMFKTLKMINTLNVTYGLVFAEILSDNGAEFAARNKPARASLRGHAARARHQAPLHQALSAADQRQGRALLAHPRRRRHRRRNLRQSRSLRQRTVRVPDLLQQPQAPSGPGRTNPKGLRRYQDHRDPISELVNIDSNDGEKLLCRLGKAKRAHHLEARSVMDGEARRRSAFAHPRS